MKNILFGIGFVFLLAACTPPATDQPIPSPTAKQNEPSPSLALPETDSLPELPEAPELPPVLEDDESNDEIIYCTQEAMECPDGSYVGREGPDCEFAACPGEASGQPIGCTEEAKLCPDGSFVSREGPNCEFAPCPGENDDTGYFKDFDSSSTPSPTTENTDSPVACTMDAKQCPDGSYVGREGPNCEFAVCPGE